MEEPKQTWNKQTLYAGIDLHKNKWVVTVRTPDVILKTFTTEPDKQVLLKTFQNHWSGAQINAAYEAGCFGYHLAEFLNSNDIKTQIIAAHTIPMAPGNFTKTDIIDSRKIAFELAKGTISGIYQRSEEELFDRHILRKRRQLLKRKKQLQVQIRADLMFFGIEPPVLLKYYWSKRIVKCLKEIQGSNQIFNSLNKMYLEEYERIQEQMKIINNLLIELIDTEKYKNSVKLLRTVPGVGALTAITLLLELGDFHRFASAEKFASYLGLTPSEFSSGDKNRKGSLTGMGHSDLRALLVEISWQAIKKDPVLLEKYERIAKGKSKCQAIVAIAKTLANRIRKVILTNEPYVIGVIK
jgi:transposase